MLQGCYVLIQVVEILLGAWMMHGLYPGFRKESTLFRGMWIIGCMLLCISYNAGIGNSFISNISVIGFSLQFASAYYICHKVNFSSIFLLEALYLTGISFLKLPVLIVEGMLFDKTLIAVNRGSRTVLECIWCIMLLMAAVLLLTGKRKVFEKHKELLYSLLSERRRVLLVVTAVQWFLLSYNMLLGEQGFRTADLVLNVLLIFSISLFFYYLLMRTAYNKIQADKKELDISQSRMQEQIEKIHELYEKDRLHLHEQCHTMEYLYCMIKEERYDEAEKYLHNYVDELDEERSRVWTGLPFLDFILNYKKQAMDQKEIRFRLELDIYEYPFEEAELGILLGNLLDNAIEACEKCAPGKREIYLHIWSMGYRFMLKLGNSSSKSPAVNGQKFITDKADKNAHGMGVELVRRIVKRYGGDISFQYSGEYFEAKLFAPITKEEEK